MVADDTLASVANMQQYSIPLVREVIAPLSGISWVSDLMDNLKGNFNLQCYSSLGSPKRHMVPNRVCKQVHILQKYRKSPFAELFWNAFFSALAFLILSLGPMFRNSFFYLGGGGASQQFELIP